VPDARAADSADAVDADAAGDEAVGDEAAGRHSKPEQTLADRARTAVRGIGQTSITLGVVILLFVVYELWFTDLINAGEQKSATNKLEKAWGSGDDPLVGGQSGDKVRSIPLGTGIAIIRIPRLGLDYARTVVEGTNADDLDIGPGHYTNSALPGQKGNLAIAGHRVGKGSPFLDLDKLLPGDAIVIETKTSWFTYRVLGDKANGSFTQGTPEGIPGREIVDPSDVKVVAPVPDHIGETPSQAMITLTTCHPKFSAHQRMIIHGVLEGKPRPRSAGLPHALRTQP
jgi:sortase A